MSRNYFQSFFLSLLGSFSLSPAAGSSREMLMVLSCTFSEPLTLALITRWPSDVNIDSMLSTSTFCGGKQKKDNVNNDAASISRARKKTASRTSLATTFPKGAAREGVVLSFSLNQQQVSPRILKHSANVTTEICSFVSVSQDSIFVFT